MGEDKFGSKEESSLGAGAGTSPERMIVEYGSLELQSGWAR